MGEETLSKKVSVVFLLRNAVDKNDTSTDMKMAYQCCVDQDISPEWISSEECLKMKPKKTDIFVIEEFTGNTFDFLKDFKCVIISPRCLMTCLMERRPIPNIPSPLFTISMVDVIVTASGFSKDQKKSLSEKIGLMGGIYLNPFNASVTHLIANTVGSQKYKVAAERGIPIMSEDWVNAVWEAGLKENVNASDPQFASYKLPAFKGILICASQISKAEKQKLMKIITENGGRYSPQLECKETNVLVIGDHSGTKLLYAKKWGIPSVTPQWVYDSASHGYSLPFDGYLSGEAKCSTPEAEAKCSTPKMGRNAGVLPDFSMCSTIVGEQTHLHINDTISSEISAIPEQNTPKKKNAGSKDYISAVDKLDVSEAKKAGSFLDGCKIYLSGFSQSQVEKLRKIINGGGATRFHQIGESVSHVIVGEFLYEEMKILKSGKYRPYVVRVDWLVESLRLGRVADEEKFLCFDLRGVEPPSPLSKKGLQLLQGGSANSSGIASTKGCLSEPITASMDNVNKPSTSKDERDLLQQYLGDKSGEKNDSIKHIEPLDEVRPEAKKSTSENLDVVEEMQSTASTKLFEGLKFVVAGFNRDEEDLQVGEELQRMLNEYGGTLVVKRFRGIPDYGIVPIEGAQLPCTVGEVVTHLWLEDCHDQDKVVPVEYYHRPFSLEPDCRPLQGCVVGISSYAGRERAFISFLAQALGAFSQEVFSKKDNPEKNAVASTHLICPTPEGNKYAAAVKWGIPAVTKDWLLACAQKRQKVPEHDYAVFSTSANAVLRTPVSMTVSSTLAKETPVQKKTLPLDDRTESSNQKPTGSCSETEGERISAVQVMQNENKKAERSQLSGVKTPTAVRMLSYSTEKSAEEEKEEVSVKELHAPDPKVVELRKEGSFVEYNFTPPSSAGNVSIGSIKRGLDLGNVSTRNLEYGDSEESFGKKAKGNIDMTPGTPYGCIFEANPSNSTKKAWKKWVDNIPRIHQDTPVRTEDNPKTPFSELKRRLWASIEQVCDNIDAKTKLELVTNEGSQEELSEGKRKRKRIDEPTEKNLRRTKPLHSVIAYIWKELPRKQREELSKKIDSLGGTVLNSYSDSITHAIFLGEESENFSEYRAAKQAGKILVAPAWVEFCAAEGEHKDESLFPPSDYKLGDIVGPGVKWESLKSGKQPALQKLSVLKSVEDESNSLQKKNSMEGIKEPFREPEVQMQLRKLDHILAEENVSPMERVRKTRASCSALREDRLSSPRYSNSPSSRNCINPPSPNTQGSGSEVVSWQENPISEELMQKVIGRKSNEENESLVENEDEEETDKGPPKFMFSSMDEMERARYREMVESLGGSVSDVTAFDIEATHLISLRPARSEKLLGSIASGKWVLHPEYLEESKRQGRFVKEDLYEWGNPDGRIPLPPEESGMERVLSEAIHRWRVAIKGEGSKKKDPNERRPCGAFEGVCAIVHMAEERARAFRRLIAAGGGTISEAKPPYCNVSDATICLMELGRGLGKVDLESLARNNIPCLKPLYLNECIIRVNPPDPMEFAIPEYVASRNALHN